MINSQISAKDKTGLGYDGQMNKSKLNNIHMNESEVVHNVFNSRESDVDDNPVNDRFKTGEGFHTVPPPYTGNYMPPTPDLSFAGSSAPLIKDWKSDSDDDCVFRPLIEQTKPKFMNFVQSGESVNSVNRENTYRQAENLRKSQSSSVDKRNWNGMMTHKLGDGFKFKKKACFVCGSLNHLIKDCNFYENKMVGKSMLNNEDKATGQREVRPVWNNAQRVNHQNKLTHPHPKSNFIPTVVLTKSGKVPVNTGSPKGGKITGKGKIRTGKLDFEDVYFVKELKFNLSSVSEMCDKKNSVLFTETECLVLSPDFKLLDEKSGLEWLFDIDSLIKSMNYEPVTTGNQTNNDAGIETNVNAGQARQEKAADHEYILLPFFTSDSQVLKSSEDEDQEEALRKQFNPESERLFGQGEATNTDSTNILNTVSPSISAAGQSFGNDDLPTNPFMPDLEDTTGIFSGAYDDENVGAEADL
ncbi:hypothetical protein Tco_1397534, partial [Tanacetum coccineum]